MFGQNIFDFWDWRLNCESPNEFPRYFITTRKQNFGKVMFLHVSVILFTQGVDATSCLVPSSFQGVWYQEVWSRDGCGPRVGYSIPPVLKSSGDHRSGKYISYWNAFFSYEIDLSYLFSHISPTDNSYPTNSWEICVSKCVFNIPN